MKYTYDPNREKDFENYKIKPVMKVAGKDIEYLLESDAPFVQIFEAMKPVTEEFGEKMDRMCIEACYAAHVDPDVLLQQARLIDELRQALDILGNNYVGCNFTELFRLREENMRLREELYGEDYGGDRN